MAITLAEAKVGMTNKIDIAVIDEFRRESFLLDSLIFDDMISPGTGGSTLGYSYLQMLTPSSAGTRKINEEYKSSEAKKTKKNTEAVIFGGKFQLDRVIMKTSGALAEEDFQLREKIKATRNEIHNTIVNGNSADEGNGVLETFDGLDKLLTGSENEIESDLDISTSKLLDDNYNELLDTMDEFSKNINGNITMYLTNKKMATKLSSAARRAGYFSQSEDAFGKTVENYNKVAIIDAGQYYNPETGKTEDVIPVDENGKTDIYAFEIGLDALHGISPDGSSMIETFLPNPKDPGAVKDGEVEIIMGIALKNTKKAGVLRGIKVA